MIKKLCSLYTINAKIDAWLSPEPKKWKKLLVDDPQLRTAVQLVLFFCTFDIVSALVLQSVFTVTFGDDTRCTNSFADDVIDTGFRTILRQAFVVFIVSA